MIQLKSNTINVRNSSGDFEGIVASGVKVDGSISLESKNPIANMAVAEALNGKIEKTSIATCAEIDSIFSEVTNNG